MTAELPNELLLEIIGNYQPSKVEELLLVLQQKTVSRFWKEALQEPLLNLLGALLIDGILALSCSEGDLERKAYAELEEECKKRATLPSILQVLKLSPEENWQGVYLSHEKNAHLFLEGRLPEDSLVVHPVRNRDGWVVALKQLQENHSFRSLIRFTRNSLSGWKQSEVQKLALRIPRLLLSLPFSGATPVFVLLKLGIKFISRPAKYRFGDTKLLMFESQENFAFLTGKPTRYIFHRQPGRKERVYWVEKIAFKCSTILKLHKRHGTGITGKEFELKVSEILHEKLCPVPYYSGHYLVFPNREGKPPKKQFLMERIC